LKTENKTNSSSIGIAVLNVGMLVPVAGLLDSIELGLELLTVYSPWEWTRRQLDALFLPAIARLSSLSSSPRLRSMNDDGDVAVAQVMLGIIGLCLSSAFSHSDCTSCPAVLQTHYGLFTLAEKCRQHLSPTP